jgi:hypothetical protein
MLRSAAVISFVILAAATTESCDKKNFASTAGACAGFEPAEYAVRGATRFDQSWIDKRIEADVAGCGFERPKPRPPEWDAQPEKPTQLKPAPKVGKLKKWLGS